MFRNNRGIWIYNFILNNFFNQQNKFLLLLLAFDVSIHKKHIFWIFIKFDNNISPNSKCDFRSIIYITY